jgi:pimeloyl-ACP methyl ester carboxylesterase
VESGFSPSYRGGSGSPLVCLHGFTESWRTWELVLPALERHHDVLAPTLAGHADGPTITGAIGTHALVDAAERAMDEAAFDTAHIVGNSLGGFVALQLAARGRARSVVALSPAGGWPEDDPMAAVALDRHQNLQELVKTAAPRADEIVSSEEGRRRATLYTTVRFEHIPTELLAHQIRAAAGCDAALPLIDYLRREGYELEPEKIECPVRIVWGTEDRLLPWPRAAVRYREEWLSHADWVELGGVGHCPQLDVPLEAAQLILGFTSD